MSKKSFHNRRAGGVSPPCGTDTGRLTPPLGNLTSKWEELATTLQLVQLEAQSRARQWGLSLVLVGWLHLLAFSFCYYLTIACDYHESAGYLAVWVAELLIVGLIFRLCGGPRSPGEQSPLSRFVARVWIAYFLLAFNLGSMNTLRGHELFELFPAMASLASFAFLVMTVAVSRRFFAAVLVMFAAGLLMAAYLLHAYLIFAIAWWAVLQGIGGTLLVARRKSFTLPEGVRVNASSPHLEQVAR